MEKVIKGRLVDLDREEIYGVQLLIDSAGRIAAIDRLPRYDKKGWYILPGLIDAHVHIESSMLLPTEFAKMAAIHGTVATVSDPHEIANVMGMQGVEYMLDNAKQTPLSINFGAPSCVPATSFETAGAVIDAQGVAELLARPDIRYLSEVMNYPGVLSGDPEVMAKLSAAKKLGKVIDGHAPGLRGEDAKAYAMAGISTDHECTTEGEARDKLDAGMQILIREGSAAKNFSALEGLIDEYPDRLMFCTDDSHPDDLLKGHINQILVRAIRNGHDFWKLLRIACRNPVRHYGLDIGGLRVGDRADFLRVDDLRSFGIMETWINGQLVSEAGAHKMPDFDQLPINRFHCLPKQMEDFSIKAGANQLRAIVVEDGEIVTGSQWVKTHIKDGYAHSLVEEDLVKIAVVNRYKDTPPAVAFVKGMTLRRGAIASSVAHDSHNIVAVGVDDASICRVVNALIESKGGIAAGRDEYLEVLPLPVAGIMNNESGPRVARRYSELNGFVKRKLRCELTAPFMTLSFLSLLVIPELKLSDKGLFDGRLFGFTELFGSGGES
ncbi:MAG: adenine deaminase [Bacteroidota bacterium]